MRKVIRSLFVLALALIMTIGMLPTEVSAASTKKKSEATSVQYYEDADHKKTGIKSFVISPDTYYNISRDPAINPSAGGADPSPTIDLNDATLMNIARKHIFPRWGVIAEGIFRDQVHRKPAAIQTRRAETEQMYALEPAMQLQMQPSEI